MTDTTAPDAITQADREAAADLIEAYWRTGDREGAQMQQLAQSYRDGHTQGVWAAAFAAHRRLAAHGAGEGLREALRAAREWITDRASEDEFPEEWGISEEWEIVGLIDRVLLTPPTDAGSTTREGGDGADVSGLRGVEKLAHLMAWHYFGLRWDCLEKQSKDEITAACQAALDWMNRPLAARQAALATTSSPDASPDSGEASFGSAMNDLAANATPMMFYDSGVQQRRLIGLAQLIERHPDRSTFAINNAARLAADLREAAAALAPSPEAPANTQGTCTCNGAGQWPLVELEHAPGCPREAANRQEAGEVEDAQAAAELVEWWDTGILRDGLVRAEAARLLKAGKSDEHSSVRRAEHEITSRIVRRSALTSPKDVKGGGR